MQCALEHLRADKARQVKRIRLYSYKAMALIGEKTPQDGQTYGKWRVQAALPADRAGEEQDNEDEHREGNCSTAANGLTAATTSRLQHQARAITIQSARYGHARDRRKVARIFA